MVGKVDENMQRAQERNAAIMSQFHFRRNVFPLDRPRTPYDLTSRPITPPTSTPNTPPDSRRGSEYSPSTPRHPHPRERTESQCSDASEEDELGDEAVEMTLDEVINGNGDTFPGLMGLVNAYLNSLNVDLVTKCELRRYLDLIKYRAKGESAAIWWREAEANVKDNC
jgi:glutamate--cysteine ligase catalytic subunit